MMAKRANILITSLFIAVFMLMELLIPGSAAFSEELDHNKGFSAILYDNTSGLPASEANAVVQTNIGFVWIGGYSGLIRYDGTTFHHFDPTSGI